MIPSKRSIIYFFSFILLFLFILKDSFAISDERNKSINFNYHLIKKVTPPISRPNYYDLFQGNVVFISKPYPKPSFEKIFPLATKTIDETIIRETGEYTKFVKGFILKNGDTLGKILKKANFSNNNINLISETLSKKVNLRKLQIGTKFEIAYDKQSNPIGIQIRTFDKKILSDNHLNNSYFDYYVLKRIEKDNQWFTLRALRPIKVDLVYRKNLIEFSLYESAKEVLIPMSKLDEFVKVMSFTIDFQREVRTGDDFEIVFEKSIDTLTGGETDGGKLLYSGMTLSNKNIGYYRYVNKNGKTGWYDNKGNSAERTLMRTPINSARISSKFGLRKHPITGFNAMHKGVDFAVPYGSAIFAAGDGRIEVAGWNGNYGKYIRIRHNGIFKTAYGHLSKIKKGVGNFVKQGEVIGYVGSTGRSTGPHLHYEIIVNNKKVNPLTVLLPSTKNVDKKEINNFQKQVNYINNIIGEKKSPKLAKAITK